MWTPTALASEARRKSGLAWRVVEYQFASSTRKLVDTKTDQDILEEILEESKPPVPRGAEQLHYLLKTPFRYDAPYPSGSRFRRAGTTEGVFYASEQIRSSLAEFCYYRLRFFTESPQTALPRQQQRLTVFSVDYASRRVIDLTRPPFVQERALWTHPSDYQATQAFADQARAANIEIIRYQSVRDVEQGANLAILSAAVFKSKTPLTQQTWFVYLSQTEANCERANASDPHDQWTFKREQFAI
jgi:hypothetical protein